MSRFRSFFTKKRLILLGSIVILLTCVGIVAVSYVTLKRVSFGGYSKESDDVRKAHNLRAEQLREHLISVHDAQEVHFKSLDTIQLLGLYIPREKPTYNLLLCHGYRSNKEALYRLADLFTEANVLMFDFRAHGQSSGDFITIGCHEYQDVIAASRYYKEMLKQKGQEKLPLIILGLSMGGAAAIKAATIEPSIGDALIIDSSYADLWDMVYRVFTKHSGLPAFPFLPVMEYILEFMANCQMRKMKPIELVKTITLPIYFIHPCSDSHTPPRDSVLMYEASVASPLKKLWIGPEAAHSRLHKEYGELYHHKVNEFVGEVKTFIKKR